MRHGDRSHRKEPPAGPTWLKTPALAKELFLRPGDLYCGHDDLWVTTLLGSCVSVVIWDARCRVGAMCHYMLTHRRVSRPGVTAHKAPDGRYGVEALAWMENAMAAKGCQRGHLSAQVFGGARIRSAGQGLPPIGDDNVRLAFDWLEARKIILRHTDVSGGHARRVSFQPLHGECRVSYSGLSDLNEEVPS
jgi:chemotaxis protein CheD